MSLLKVGEWFSIWSLIRKWFFSPKHPLPEHVEKDVHTPTGRVPRKRREYQASCPYSSKKEADPLGWPHCVTGTELDPPPPQNNWKTEQDKGKVFRHSTTHRLGLWSLSKSALQAGESPWLPAWALWRWGVLGLTKQSTPSHWGEKGSEAVKAKGAGSWGAENRRGGRYREEEF